MSISEFICEGGYVPGLSEHLWEASMFMWDNDPFSSRPSGRANTERREKVWKALCRDDKWKFRSEVADSYVYTYGEEVNRDAGDYWGARATFRPVPSIPEGMHRGSLAPDFIWKKVPPKDDHSTQEPSNKGDIAKLEEEYLQRLICVLAGRFVCLPNENEDVKEKGIPRCADRYRWRYWDNDGNIYQENAVKFVFDLYPHLKKTASTDSSDLFDHHNGRQIPGAFDESPLWMFSQNVFDRDFWEALWCWKFEGTTGSEEWDEGLWKLAEQAGVSAVKQLKVDGKERPLNESELDRIAEENGWKKLTCLQPAMSSYTRDPNERINFYLSTGTAGTCLNHPTQGKTQLFRRGLDMATASTLLRNPRQHTGRGYKHKASEPRRECASCKEEKLCNEFSKNQRRKGSSGKCMDCVSKHSSR